MRQPSQGSAGPYTIQPPTPPPTVPQVTPWRPYGGSIGTGKPTIDSVAVTQLLVQYSEPMFDANTSDPPRCATW